MGKKWLLGIGLMVSVLTYQVTFAQEEESAEVYLEEYTDEFQENFFEALKQKGIQNYDRAIGLLLKCKQLEPTLSVIDYELAKAYAADGQFIKAQEYAIAALNAESTDYWYLDNLLSVLDAQGNTLDAVKQNIPFNEQKLQENLALAYFQKKKYEDALKVIPGLRNTELANELRNKINDSLAQNKPGPTKKILSPTANESDENPVARYQKSLEDLLEGNQYDRLILLSKEALDAYPLQPYFYYAYGAALNGTLKANKAIEVLETGLDYLLDDDGLANKFYVELSKAYSNIGNTTKANEYANKIKPGL